MRGQHTSRRGERARFRGGSRRWRRGAAGLPWPSHPPYASLWRFWWESSSYVVTGLLPRRDEVAALSTAVGKRQRRLNGLAQGGLATSEERTPATAASRPFIAPIGLWRGYWLLATWEREILEESLYVRKWVTMSTTRRRRSRSPPPPRRRRARPRPGTRSA